MRITTIHLDGKVWWRLSPTMTISPAIPAIGGWSIASPLAVDRPFQRPRHLLAFADGTVLLDSASLVLVANDNASDVQGDCILQYLNALRVVSRQSRLPRSIVAMGTGDAESNDFTNSVNVGDFTAKGSVRKYIAESSLTLEHLKYASDALINDAVPVHGELANDAAESTIRSNFRSAIIYSAATIESCAGSALDREYGRLLSESSPSAAHRRVTIQVSQNESVDKDPIYLALRNGTGDGGSRFLSLLHECPLYLLGRSLKLDNSELYRQAHSLYRTRNSLAHTGTTDIQKSGLLSVDYDGAMIALTTADRVLRWFGEKGMCIPDNEMIECRA